MPNAEIVRHGQMADIQRSVHACGNGSNSDIVRHGQMAELRDSAPWANGRTQR